MTVLVTGGAGFIGSALVKALVKAGEYVHVFDNCSRSTIDIEKAAAMGVHVYEQDIRDEFAVEIAAHGCDEIIHLAYINGTKNFYDRPAEVLDVGVRGMLSVIRACDRLKIKKLMLASSSEVCRADVGGMNESVPLVIPDPFNPRYSYSAGKIISEMLAIHSGLFDHLTIIRPFNIYGPGMHEGHVVPDFKARLASMNGEEKIFSILGDANETRSFCYIDDFIDGVMLVREFGKHLGVYNIGTTEEVTIGELATRMAGCAGKRIIITDKNELREGSIARRKPDISKLQELGYEPKISLDEGLRRVMCH